MTHIPVLLNEVLEYVGANKGKKFIDGTVGDGGHALALLDKNPEAKVLGLDLDQGSLDRLAVKLEEKNLISRINLKRGSFARIKQFADEDGFNPVSGVILDLGFSSSQLDEPARGLSFQNSGPLDMRFDQSQRLTAGEVINKYPEAKLENVIKTYGEERFSRKIALKIIETRKESPIENTAELFKIIKEALPKNLKHKASDSARRVFQALRIEVNSELKNLTAALEQILEILEPEGRMAIISFHSLEDRIVKRFLLENSKGCICPPEFPTCVCKKGARLRILTRKPVIAQEQEIQANSRSKPAKLRAAEKI
ncbi:MAG TPA: 16S rRNA (cytosine(1402)-N(4))-methyltransferase RsmH [Patescibacteria group bacterium]|jgi:16S rRNA (cytosine1402-N4)-methyltransferase|nr:16S rRNA (cytosine(1402)-N(4))-methyltransferase RsmH [Patescibacteria group bacterium]